MKMTIKHKGKLKYIQSEHNENVAMHMNEI